MDVFISSKSDADFVLNGKSVSISKQATSFKDWMLETFSQCKPNSRDGCVYLIYERCAHLRVDFKASKTPFCWD